MKFKNIFIMTCVSFFIIYNISAQVLVKKDTECYRQLKDGSFTLYMVVNADGLTSITYKGLQINGYLPISIKRNGREISDLFIKESDKQSDEPDIIERFIGSDIGAKPPRTLKNPPSTPTCMPGRAEKYLNNTQLEYLKNNLLVDENISNSIKFEILSGDFYNSLKQIDNNLLQQKIKNMENIKEVNK